MDNTRDVSEDGQKDVDEKVGVASTFKKDTKRRKEDGEDDLKTVLAT